MFKDFYKSQNKSSPLARLRGDTQPSASNRSTTTTSTEHTVGSGGGGGANGVTTTTTTTTTTVNGGGAVQLANGDAKMPSREEGKGGTGLRPPPWEGEGYEDLLSKDKAKQKSAVKRYLAEQIRNDWDFAWPAQQKGRPINLPPPDTKLNGGGGGGNVQDETLDEGYTADSQSDHATPNAPTCDPTLDDENDNESIYSIVSEDPTHYRPRIEWTSDLSENDLPGPLHSKNKVQQGGESSPIAASPFLQIDYSLTPAERKVQIEARRKQRRRELREEMQWNQGLACFEARRDAWTGGRTVRVREKPSARGGSSSKNRRFSLFRRSGSGSGSGSPPTTTLATDTESSSSPDLNRHATNNSLLSDEPHPSSSPFTISTLIPLAPPLLPPSNILRASITPTVYINLYEKVVLQNMQPSCPINLSDMVRSCVVGWQRDGEWPPRPALPGGGGGGSAQAVKRESGGGGMEKVRRLSFGLLGKESKEVEREKEKEKGRGFRRSLRGVFGMGGGG